MGWRGRAIRLNAPSSTTAAGIAGPKRLLITAGPTHEPIDAVRYIGNRSSGRLGIALADEAAARGWRVALLLGPSALTPKSSRVEVVRFRTTADLEALLRVKLDEADVLVMAAAVADFRPKTGTVGGAQAKLRRNDGAGGGLTLELEPTPDLLAGCAKARRADQILVGFALEPGATLLASAESKLRRKGVDLIVANALDTMDAPAVEATVVGPAGIVARTPGSMTKELFAPWLLDVIAKHAADSRPTETNPS
ncbi:MAG TPA: phosphopantothenoylcysteine decarboxylase [Phycisphaerales bacterium]|nr:phosphopantothenoylcysteine decarboxylase [Phycisphaerales bacterium]